MPEQQNPEPDKSRKTRSFGSFMIFLFVLLVVLAYVAQESMNPPDRLSQDQYEWKLYNGQIEHQEFSGDKSGTRLIKGDYSSSEAPNGRQLFEVSFADVKDNESLYQQLKAELKGSLVGEQAFLQAVEEGWYTPVSARALSSFERSLPRELPRPEPAAETPPVAPGAASEGSALAPNPAVPRSAAPITKRNERLWVEVVARSKDSWDAAKPQPFWLPESSGHEWLEVGLKRDSDLAGLLGTLQARGLTIERRNFDLSDKDGSRFTDSTSMLTTALLVWGPWILIFAVVIIFLRQLRSQGGAGGVMSFGRSRAQLYTKENRTNVTFDDVAGADEAKAEVREIVEFLKNPGRFTRIGGRIPRGVLLVGPPGCGKTLLAKAIAGEAEVPFYSISGSDFVEMFVGVGASRVRDLFKQARENSPCIIFLDEIDAVGRRRGSGMGGGHDEREQTLNAILVEMDGFGTDEGIILVAATNRPDVLDPALLRPGRFDREVTIDLPDMEGREQILKVHLRKVKASTEVNSLTIAKSTPGYSGADLSAIVNEAAIMAVLAKRDLINMEDLEEARDKVRYGRQKKSRKIEEEDRKITAYHEAGHAVVAATIPEADDPHKVTIVPRGRALGTTMMLPDKESYHMQKKRLVAQLCMAFGGRAAEAEFCGDISAGASEDIRRATELARAMVTELGMSDKIGPINYAERQGSDFLGTELMRGKSHSEDTAREIDREVYLLLTSSYQRAVDIVREERVLVEALAQSLLIYETISGEEVKRLRSGVRPEDLRPSTPESGPKTGAAAKAGMSGGERAGEDLRRGELPGTPGLSPA